MKASFVSPPPYIRHHMTQSSEKTARGPFFVVLLKHDKPTKSDSVVLWTTNPASSVNYMHRNKYPGPGWRLMMTLGPFADPGVAQACAWDWVNGTRGFAAKFRKGPFMAEKYGGQQHDGAPPDYTVGSTDFHKMAQRLKRTREERTPENLKRLMLTSKVRAAL
jgi:hypothetical protein